jgi:hypothetical protein
MTELTEIEALCILSCGWSNDVEKELNDLAWVTIRKVSEKAHLKYELHKINKKLEDLK